MTTTAQKIAVMQAYEEGKPIEVLGPDGEWIHWTISNEPNWS